MDSRDLLVLGGVALLVYLFVFRKPTAAVTTQSQTSGAQKEAPGDVFQQILGMFGALTSQAISAAQTSAQKQ